MDKPQHILIIGTVWPEPCSSAAGNRMMQLIELFQLQGWKITFASAAADSEFMFDLKKTGVEKVTIELNNNSFDSFIQQLKPDIVIFDRFMTEEQFGWRIVEQCPKAMRILDTEDLHCLRSARQKAFKENRKFSVNDLLTEDVAKREVASIYRSDLSLIISDFEMNILEKQFKVDKALLHYIPFMLDLIDDKIIHSWKNFEEREHFISIGNFLHEPNWNAVLFLKEEIWPLIRKKLPQAELHIYGAYPSQKVNELHQPKESFYVKGRAEDAKEVMSKARVCLAPLRFGAGIKGKLVEAMQCGTPSVTTSIGAEAMHGNLEWSGSIENDAKSLAEAAVKLYTDNILWQQSQAKGKNIINVIYSKELLGAELIQRILALQNNLEDHRKQNFTGNMLMHHSMVSSKYMSKWIEEKNKVREV
ncbi:MAG: glycosyltransferase [Bacteroidota bacterium]